MGGHLKAEPSIEQPDELRKGHRLCGVFHERHPFSTIFHAGADRPFVQSAVSLEIIHEVPAIMYSISRFTVERQCHGRRDPPAAGRDLLDRDT